MGADMAESLGVTAEQTSPVCAEATFSTAGNSPLTCIGQFDATVALGDCQTSTRVFVLREVTGLLLGWCDAVRLRILPADFPAQIPVSFWRDQSVPDRTRAGDQHIRSQSVGVGPPRQSNRQFATPVGGQPAPPTGRSQQHATGA